MRLAKPKSSQFPFAVGIPAILWQLLFFYLPLLLIICSSFIAISKTGKIEGFTLNKIYPFLNPTYMRVIFSSVLLGLGNAAICFCIAYPLAYFMVFKARKIKNLLLFLLIIPFWTNFLLHVYAWFFVLERNGFLNNLLKTVGLIQESIPFMNSLFATMVMMVYYYLPFMVLPLYSSLEKFDYRLIESSVDLGASWLQTLRQIIFPLTLGGIKAGFFLVYIPSFGEFAIPELMGGDKQMFVGSVVARYILGDQTGSLGAAFTVLSCAILSISAFCFYYLIKKIFTPKGSYALKK
ncbi:MAG: ABC transporter permease [Verrucomicrobia bacterium]|nr:ABC transporter permease [Verrucomicrobiota bacterium]